MHWYRLVVFSFFRTKYNTFQKHAFISDKKARRKVILICVNCGHRGYLEQIFNAVEMKLNTTSTALREEGLQVNR